MLLRFDPIYSLRLDGVIMNSYNTYIKIIGIRIKKVLSYLSSRGLVWNVPNEKDVIILGEIGSQNLIPSLEKDIDFFIFKHESQIYIKYLFRSIFTCKSFKLNAIIFQYYIEIIERVDPKLVITNNDNVPFYWKLDKAISHRINFLTVQNGTHLLGSLNNIPSYYKTRFLESIPYYSNLACLSKFDFDYYTKYGAIIESYHTIGSILISSYISNYKKVDKIYDVCIVANSDNSRLGEKTMLNYMLEYLKTHKIKVCIALKKECYLLGSRKGLRDFFGFLNNEDVFLFGRAGNKSQHLSDLSEVTIGHGTTLLRQSFSRGNKIYPINFVNPLMSPPFDSLEYTLSPTYDEFEEHMNYLLSIDSIKYCKRYSYLMKYIDTFDSDDTPHLKLKKIVNSLVYDK